MKVLFIFPSSLRSIGGVSNWAREVISRLVLKGIDVRVYASSFVDGIASNSNILKFERAGIFYRELSILGLGRCFYIMPFSTKSLAEIKRAAQEADVIYTQNIFLGQDIQLLNIMRETNVPTIIGYHTPIFNGRFMHDFIVKISLKNWKAFSAHHVLTPQQKNLLVSNGFKSVHLIPNGVDVQKFSNTAKKESNNFRVLFVGKLEKRKGIELLLKCAKNLRKIIFVIVGDGPLKDEVLFYAKKYDNVIYTGFVEEEKIRLFYKNSHVFVLPSKAEGLPLVVLEAMASGLFTISSLDYGILPAENIFLKHVDEKGIFESICQAHNLYTENPKKFETISRKNREIAKRADWKIIAEKITDLFHEISKM